MKDNISSAQWFAVLAASVAAILMMNYVRLFVSEVGRGTYISALLISVLTGLFLIAIIAVMKRNDFRSPQENITLLLGRKVALCLCSLTAIGFFLFTVETLNICVYIVKFYFLPRTPTPLLAAVLFLPTAYTAYCGFRTFGSVASAALISFFLFLAMFFFTKNNYLPSNLMPWNDFQWSEIFTSLPFLFLSAPALASSFFVLPYCDDHKGLMKRSLLFVFCFGALTLFLYAAGMAYFGETIIQRLTLPFYNLSPFFKGNLLERFDILYMLALLPTVSVFNSFAFSVFDLIRREILIGIDAKHHGKIILLCSAITVTASSFTVNRFAMWQIYQYCNLAALGITLFFLLLSAASAMKRRRLRHD